ncbi:hypothetical protein Tco_1474969 [Tanacetum coccineum]
MIYPISDSPWVSPVHYVPKKGGITVVANEENELILTRLVTGWRVCIDYRKMEFSGICQIPIDPQDQEKTTFTCPYGTFAYRLMQFSLCNAPDTFQRYKMLTGFVERHVLVLNWEKCHFMCIYGSISSSAWYAADYRRFRPEEGGAVVPVAVLEVLRLWPTGYRVNVAIPGCWGRLVPKNVGI